MAGQGPFTIYAVVVDADGHTTDVPVKVDENGNPTEFSVAITVDNEGSVKPFGVLDTPDQGGTASGAAYVNFGWALAKQPKLIPTDGSTMWVFVDGQPLGHPSYGYYRSDLATLFPVYKNTDAAVGYFYLDTTTLTPGLHNIEWSVSDDAGVTEGIGSRLFSVLNVGTQDGAVSKQDCLCPFVNANEKGDEFLQERKVTNKHKILHFCIYPFDPRMDVIVRIEPLARLSKQI